MGSIFKSIIDKDKYNYLYRCSKCGVEDWYIIDLPAHMLKHDYDDFGRRLKCGGILKLIEKQLIRKAKT